MSSSNLQALTLAISPNGVNYFAQVMVADLIIDALTSMQVPTITASPDPIQVYYNSQTLSSMWAMNIEIDISGGSFSNFNPQFSSLAQGDDGLFTLTIVATDVTVNYSDWNEQYDLYLYNQDGDKDIGPSNSNYSYSLGIGSFTLVVPVTFAQQADSYTITVGTVVPTLANLTPNIPSQSVVNQAGACFTTYVQQSTVTAVENIDFQTPLQTLLDNLFGTIPASGQVATDITYSFAEGTSPMAFPDNEGITIGITGDVTWTDSNDQSTDYASVVAPPSPLAIPSVPTNQDVQIYVSDWDFNALYWGYFNQDLLSLTVTPSDLQDPAPLQTDSYDGTSLQALYTNYPNTTMQVAITATVAPTVTFEQVYYFGPAQLTTLQGALPSDVYTDLSSALSSQVFQQQADLVTAVTNALGSGPEGQYISVIENATQIYGAIFTHSPNAAFSVKWQGNLVPVFTANFSLVDFQYNFLLGASGTVQTVQFGFQSLSDLTTASIVSSQIGTLTTDDITQLWIFTLGPAYQQQMAAMGQTGVPVPFIAGFEYLFQQATVAVNEGYVSVLADVQYNGTPATEIVPASGKTAAPRVKTVVGIPRVSRA